jgi:hypothetical protein
MPDSAFWSKVKEQRDGGPDANEVLQRLYDSEINARIGWVWDGGVTWQLGDKHNGWKATGNEETVALAAVALAKAAAEHYPGSEFGKWGGSRQVRTEGRR